MSRHIYWIWLRMALGGNIKVMYALYIVAGDIHTLFRADRDQYTDWGVPASFIKALTDKDLTPAYNILGQCEKFGIGIIAIDDDDYPDSLRQIALPPCMLFYQGALFDNLNAPNLTVVGTRYCTAGGEAVATEFATGLSLSGFSLFCGVAEGIESALHRAIVQADGRNVLFLPCGHLAVSKRVKHLMLDVLPRGAVVSELLPHERAPYDAYQMRNRLLSAMSLGTLVLQAPAKSGVLITAGYALEQGRDVFVLPGSLRDPSYAGNNRLLRDGAMPIIEFNDIVEYYKPRFSNALRDIEIEDKEFESFVRSVSQSREFDSTEQQRVYSVISPVGVTIDEIVLSSGVPASRVLSELTIMEMKGWISPLPGGKYKSVT